MTSPYRNTLRLSGAYAFASLARRAMQVILLPVYTAVLSTTEYGQFALINVTVIFLAHLLETPMVAGALERFYYHPAYRNRNGELLFNVALFLLLALLAVAGVYLLFARPITHLLYGGAELLPLVQLYALVLVLMPLWSMTQTLVQLHELATRFTVANLVSALAAGGVTLMGLLWLKIGVYAVAWGLITGYAVCILIYLPPVLRAARFRLAPSLLKHPLRYGLPLAPSGISRMVMQMGDRYVLRFFRPMSEVGVYSFGFAIAEVADTALVGPLMLGVGPTIRRMEADPDEQRLFIRQAATSYYGLALFVGLAIALAAPEAVRLLARDAAYWACIPIIPLVTLAFVQHVLGLFAEWGIVMTNRSHVLSGATIGAALVNVGLNILLIPHWGILGAAAATLLAALALNAVKMIASAKFYHLHFELRRLVHVTAVAVAVYLASAQLPADASLWLSVPARALLLAAMPVLCLATGAVSRAEKQFVIEIVRRLLGRMGQLLGRRGPHDDPPDA